MWTRGRDKDGTFKYTVYGYDNKLHAEKSGFTDYKECELEAQKIERMLAFDSVDIKFKTMTDDEILAALMA